MKNGGNGIWPAHCVAGEPGAEFHPDLKLPVDAMVFSKGSDPAGDAYSALCGTSAASVMHDAGITRLIMCGLATDYCVKNTALDCLKEGFKVVLVSDGCRAVNVEPGDEQKALDELKAAGCEICTLAKVQF